MTKEEWFEKIEEFVGEIECDRDLSTPAYLEVLDELVSIAGSAATAKREELGED